MVAALVLTGAPGAGKSSVLEALTTLLELRGVPHGAIESELLARGVPLLPARDWTTQLAAVLQIQRAAGRETFLIAATTQDARELAGVIGAAAADRSLVVCLRAAEATVAARLQVREPDAWPGKAELVTRARGLATSIPQIDGIDLVLDTEGRDADEVAAQVLAAMQSRGLLAG
jgi:GTPase SAR1 family protein